MLSAVGVRLRHAPLAALFASLTAICAYISVPLPFSPVPITLQTLMVYLSGSLLGARPGAVSQLLYLLMGLLGLPVFAGGRSGIIVLLGPTGGYLIGFIAGAYVTGKLSELRPRPNVPYLAMSMAAGTVPIYGLGVLGLTIYLRMDVGWALSIGVLPFLPGDALKIVLASYLAARLRAALERAYTTRG